MDPPTTCCPHLACPARGQTGQGTMGLHACKDTRCICTECPKPCRATQGTACERLRTSAEPGRLVGTRLAHGCPRHALGVALGAAERPVAGWGARGGAQGQAVQEPLVEPPRAVGQGQAEEVRVKKQGAMVWRALARRVRPRLGRAGEGSARRAMALRRGRRERGRRGARPRPRVGCPAGRIASGRAGRETWRAPGPAGASGRPRGRPWRHRCLAQVVKRDAQRGVVEGARRSVAGTPARGETRRRRAQGDGGIHPACSRAAPCDGPGALGVADTPRPGAGAPHVALAAGEVRGRPRRARLHAARASVRGRWQADASEGGGHDGAWLDRPGTAVVSCPAAARDTPQARGRPSHALQRLMARWGGDHG